MQKLYWQRDKDMVDTNFLFKERKLYSNQMSQNSLIHQHGQYLTLEGQPLLSKNYPFFSHTTKWVILLHNLAIESHM